MTLTTISDLQKF